MSLMAIPLKYLLQTITLHLLLLVLTFAQHEREFIYNGFNGAVKLHLDGSANLHRNGLLQMTNISPHETAHAFYPYPMSFKPSQTFSTSFVFAIYPQVKYHSGFGLAFVISGSINLKHALSARYFGLFDNSSVGLPSNHLFAVVLDTVPDSDASAIQGEHVSVLCNNLTSIASASASYYSDKDGVNKSLLLRSEKPIRAWIDYDEAEMVVNVTLAPISHPKPSKSLLSKKINLSSVFLESMYIGFSATTGVLSNSHFLLGWSWNQTGKAQDLDASKLPSLPVPRLRLSRTFVVLLALVVILFIVMAGVAWTIRRRKYEELYEPWEQEYAPHRISFKDLFVATKGFGRSEILGAGGFGKVYKGLLPPTDVEIAVKRISHDSRQGMTEFMAEIASMRRLRHRNLVQLLGYCRRKGELLLVYDYMPNGSLDKFLFGNKPIKSKLCWSQRFKIIKGVAAALLYLHEGWEQVVLHRDVKASNVLLDAEMNARLGDFGLARLYDHNANPLTTHLVGTMGYIAPEACRTRKPTIFTDIYAFGIFLLEVSCGRRPMDLQEAGGDIYLVDWVCDCWKRGVILEASDPKLEGCYSIEEMELVLKLGLLCVHPVAEARPTMRQIVRFLDGDAPIPDIPSDFDPRLNGFGLKGWGSSSSLMPSSSGMDRLGSLPSADSVLVSGR